MTARDVAFTYGILGDEELASAQQNYVESLDSVVADNDSTVTFHYARRYPEMLFHSGHGIVPRHVSHVRRPALRSFIRTVFRRACPPSTARSSGTACARRRH